MAFGKKNHLRELDDAEKQGLQYCTLALGNVGAWSSTELLNAAWQRGWKVTGVAGQQATTLFVLERRELKQEGAVR